MRKIFTLLMLSVFFYNADLIAQSVYPEFVATPVYSDISIPVRDMPTISELGVLSDNSEENFERNEELSERSYPFYDPLPNGIDPALQRNYNNTRAAAIIEHNYNGQTSSSFPPDCNGSVGPGYFFQSYNTSFAIYNRSTEALVSGPTAYNTLFSGVTGADRNDGDPIILYDEQADRWLAAEFSLGSTKYMLIAVSETNDPTGSWYRWSFEVADTPDYMKFGVWRDGYYMATNTSGGTDVYAFERDVMLAGGSSPQMVAFDNPNRPSTQDGFHCIMPLDNDGDFAPVGTPGQFMTIVDGAISGGSDELWVYEMDVDWSNTNNSTFARTQQIAVPAFDSNFGSGWDNIAQPGTSQELDAIPQILMYRVQYRNFGSTQTAVACHTVDVDGTDHAGVRWYELENTGSGWSIRQSGTYSPDGASRWMGSIAMNGNHEIGLAYSIVDDNNNIYPGIRFTGQSAAENATASGNFDITETTAVDGGTYQASYNRWGDYSQMSVDPYDDNTFWFSSEYMQSSTSTKSTRILAFKFQELGDPLNLTATAVASDEIDLTWALNSNNDNVLLAWSSDGTFGTPADGTTYSAGQTIPGGGTVLSYNSNTSFNHLGLNENTTYYYKAWSYQATNTYSPGVTASATTPSGPVSTFPFTWDFESSTDYTTDFTPWTTVDGNGVTTYSSSDADWTGEGTAYAWMAMNPVASGWTASAQGDDAHGGSRCGMSVCPNDGSTTDHWFISPQLQLGDNSNFSLWALTPKTDYGLGVFEILVSTTDNTIGSFTAIASNIDAPDTWTQLSYDLSAYNNQNIYIAIHDVTPDYFMMWIDDLEITSNTCIAPTVTSQPTSQTVCNGDNVTFNITATGDATITYQWQFNGSNISGATSNTYTVNSVTSTNAGDYTCYMVNGCGNTTSNTATLTVSDATVITSQPTGNTYCEGDNLSLNIFATGGNLTYQWQLDGNDISGATTATYTTTASTTDAGNYTCVVSGDCGNLTSSTATVTVNAATTINTQPANVDICENENATFTTSATGTNISYQWQFNGNNISGATTDIYTINGATFGNSGDYTCVITGDCGNVTSNTASLTVSDATVINTQPTGNVYCEGDNLSLSVSATGGSLTYQWQLNDSNISGATSATYTTTAETSDAGDYTCIVTGPCGSITSSSATVTVDAATVINTQPTNIDICDGENATFTTGATGTNISYQWQLDGNNISGANTDTYTINGATSANAGSYTCIVSGDCGNVTSNTATLSVGTTPSITTQPISVDANAGDNVSFTVVASGTGLAYQWNKNSSALVDGGNISGATTNTLSITNVASADYGDYNCDITGTCGNISSDVAVLSILSNLDVLTKYGVVISPNPSNGTFTVKLDNNVSPIEIKVVNVNGKIVYNKTYTSSVSNTVDLSSEAKGVYFITLKFNDELVTAKLIFK